MPCDTKLLDGQSISDRKKEIVETVSQLDQLIKAGKVRARVGAQGAVTFVGWADSERNRITDACAYRRIMATGSAFARAEIARAEQTAGRSVNRQAVGAGVHSHDGGRTWHDHKG